MRHTRSTAIAAGAGVGSAAWLLGWLPVAALMFVVAPAIAGRGRAYALALGYYLAASIGIVPGTGNFFLGGTNLVLGLAFWFATSATLALPWALLDRVPAGRALNVQTRGTALLALLAAEVLLCVPPLALFGWANPLFGIFAAGPWFYVVPVLVVGACLAVYMPDYRIIALGVVVLALAGTPTKPPPGWLAIGTHYGKQQDSIQGIARALSLEHKTLAAFAAGKHVVVTPEAVAGVWYAGTAVAWKPVIAYTAKHPGSTALVGTMLPSGQRLLDGIMQISDGKTTFHADALPVPVSMWHPWQRWHNFPLDLVRPEMLSVSGRRVAYLVCYEQLMGYSAIKLMLTHPDLVVGIANDWWSPALVRRQQEWSLAAIARFLDVPFVDAVNA